MKWTAPTFTVRGQSIRSKCAIQSEEGYVVSRYMPEGAEVYIARCPAGRIIYSGVHSDRAKEACEQHLAAQERAA